MKNQALDGVVTDLVKETVTRQVNGAVIKALRSLDFQKIVGDFVSDHLKTSLTNYTFPKNSIKAESINFEGYKQIHKNFTSTGIDDRSESIQLTVLNENVVIENSLVAKNITLQDNIDVGKRIKAKSLSITESSLFAGNTLMLGKLTTQGENEFKGVTKFTGGIDVKFNDGQIPHGAINWKGFEIPQDQVQSGKIENFSSLGIEDKATSTQVNVTDGLVSINSDLSARKIEGTSVILSGKVISDSLQVENGSILKGNTEIHDNVTASKNVDVHGKLTVLDGIDVRGVMSIPDTLKDSLVEYMNSKINLESIVPEGGSIYIGKRAVLDEQSLGGTIISSNLRKVGTLKELEVAGESKLNSTYFSSLGRVGINTDDPTAPLDVWDDEVQITLGKSKAKTGWVGTGRDHSLELGVNRDPKITITSTETIIKNPVLNDRTYTQGSEVPGHAGSIGDIHWNTEPDIGKPVGWVCLSDTRWAKFGDIK